MPLLGWKLEALLKSCLKLGDIVHADAAGFENMEEFRWYALGLILGALGMKKYYDPDPKIDETIHELSQLNIRPKESLEEIIRILENYLRAIGWLPSQAKV